MNYMYSILVVLGSAQFIASLNACDQQVSSRMKFVSRIDAVKSWVSLTEMEIAKHEAEIEKLGLEFREFAIDEARHIVNELREMALKRKRPSEPEESLGKIYVLLRYYFKVPETEDPSRVKYFGGWVGVPMGEGRVGILWPLGFDAVQGLQLQGSYKGYNGDTYDPVSEFDFFNERFGRRWNK